MSNHNRTPVAATSINEESFLSLSSELLNALRSGLVGAWRWRIGSDELKWTDNLEVVHRLSPGTFDGTIESFQKQLHPEDAQSVWDTIQRSIESNEPYKVIYRSIPVSNQSSSGQDHVWIEATGNKIIEDGESFLTGVCFDVSDRIRQEHVLARRMKQQSGIKELGEIALREDELQKILEEAVRISAHIFDSPLVKILQFADSADELLLKAGVGWHDGLIGNAHVGIEKSSQAGYTLLNEKPIIVDDLQSETRFSGPTLLHHHGVRSGMSVVIQGPDRRPYGVFGVHKRTVNSFDDHDASALSSIASIVAHSIRHQHQKEYQNLLMREMTHRAGNMLQLVNAIASQTFRNTSDIETARRSLSERLSWMAKSNLAIAKGGWGQTRFKSLLEEALSAFHNRFDLQGPDILLTSELCFDLSLVLHELMTNSSKYGALSDQDEKIFLHWSTYKESDLRYLVIQWDDLFPTRFVKPLGTGFGSKFKKTLIETKWNGKLEINFEEGYHCTVTLPIPEERIPKQSISN